MTLSFLGTGTVTHTSGESVGHSVQDTAIQIYIHRYTDIYTQIYRYTDIYTQIYRYVSYVM